MGMLINVISMLGTLESAEPWLVRLCDFKLDTAT
jgi:hypothetical protein